MALSDHMLGRLGALPRPLRWPAVLVIFFTPTLFISIPVYMTLDALIGGLGLTPLVLRALAAGALIGGGGLYAGIQLVYAARADRERTFELFGVTAVTFQSLLRIGFFIGWFVPVLIRYASMKMGWF